MIKEALWYSVIPAIPFATHALYNTKRLQDIDCTFACVLNTPIRMKDHILAEFPVSVGHHNGRYYCLICIHPITDRPTNRLTIEKVENNRQVNKAIGCRNISQVRDTSNCGFFSIEIPVQYIRGHLIFVRRICGPLEAFRKLAAQSSSFHMFCYSQPRNQRASHLEVFCQPRTTIATFGHDISILNLFFKSLALPTSFTIGIFQPKSNTNCGKLSRLCTSTQSSIFQINIL